MEPLPVGREASSDVFAPYAARTGLSCIDLFAIICS
jgi:hypothetical protein